MNGYRGYALLETLLALLILSVGLVSVASLFSVTTTANIRNRQRTAATLLIYDKLEQFQPQTATPGSYSENISILTDGTIFIDSLNLQAPFLRQWQVQSSPPTSITVIVFARVGNAVPLELARATRVIGH